MTSVERVIEYSKLPSEAALESIAGGLKNLCCYIGFDLRISKLFRFREETSRNLAFER